MKIIARIRTDFPTKFGIPRQPRLAEHLKAAIVLEPGYRDRNALRGLEGFSHIWLVWQFSEAVRDTWSPMVKPPRLGGNKRMGVFATRSPFRPNPIGLSAVKLLGIGDEPGLGPVLYVSGADLMDGTPIFDIKPYLPLADCIPEATDGFAADTRDHRLQVVFPEQWLQMIPESKRPALFEVLEQDPRPGYQDDPTRRYGFAFSGVDVRFTVEGEILTVCEIVPLKNV